MNKLKELGNQYFYVIAFVFFTVVGMVIISLYNNWQDGEINRTVSNQTNQANQAVQQAVNAQNAAINADVQRQTEDAIREKVINPKLDESRRRSNTSKAELDAAKRRYQNAKNNPANLNTSDADNCLKLRDLFPDINFADCQ